MVHLPSDLDLALRILLAAVLGGVIGLEREVNDHPAGLRTHIAVAVGAALFGVVSAYGWGAFALESATNYRVDVTRVASQVPPGMGFLGGGAILKYGANIKGLTTAASLWVTAAIGLAAAVGMYWVAAATTFGVLTSLVFLRFPRDWIDRRLAQGRRTIVVELEHSADPAEVLVALTGLHGLRLTTIRVRVEDDITYLDVECSGPPREELEPRLAAIARHMGVREVTLS
ncbi:MAG TPA: MgtC/SapB family protein [Acidimicrobiales bacterium]|nr:MgtC/SapB family protein [Acidimicrobiales bacterium]